MFTETDLIVGVDVHRRTNVTQVMDGAGQAIERPGRFANNRTGTDKLAACLAQIAASGGYRAIHIAAEATNNFWLPFFCQLSQSRQLSAWPLALYPFNPRVIHNFKKALGDLEKTADRDAGVAAERLRFGKELPLPDGRLVFTLAIFDPLPLPSGPRTGAGQELLPVAGLSQGNWLQ